MGVRDRMCRRLLAAMLGVASGWTAAVAAADDIIANDIEVTQAVQDLDNGVRLVRGKNTYVRFHLRGTPGPIFNVKAALAAGRIAGPGPIGFLGVLQPLNPDGVVKAVNVPRKEDLDDSFYFQLPPSWRQGTVEIFVSADPLDNIAESNEANNTLLESVVFEEVPPARVRIYDVGAPGLQPPSAVDHERFASWLRAGYPIAKLLVERRDLGTAIDWQNDVCNCTKDNDGNCTNMSGGTCNNSPGYPCDADVDCGCGRLNIQLAQLRSLDQINQPGFEPDQRYIAWVDDSSGFMRGCSPGSILKVASGPVGVQLQSQMWDTDGSYADWYTAHELGHTYARPHAPCCGAAQDPMAPPYPYSQCRISDGTHVGFDVRDLTPYPGFVGPGNYNDVMSYCSLQWISDFTYEAIMQKLIDEDGAPAPPPLGPGDFALVLADTNDDLNAAQLRVVQRLPNILSPFPLTSSGPYTIELRDASGGVLATYAAQPSEMVIEAAQIPPGEPLIGPVLHRTGLIREVVPLVANTAAIVIVKGGVDLDTQAVSANAPTVTIQSPNGGESLSGSATVTWLANDADSDPLTFTLLYSADGGSSWNAVATDIAGTSVDVSLLGLTGGNTSLFRVIASDGFLTGQDDSDAVFAVAGNAPVVRILSPVAGIVYAPGTILSLEADASDTEDGELDGASVVWTSDRRGLLGTGANLEVPAVFGSELLTVTATDAAGNTTSASIQLGQAAFTAPVPTASPRGLLVMALSLIAIAGLAWARRRVVPRP